LTTAGEGRPFPCPRCHTATTLRLYPTFARPDLADPGADALPGDAACFHHPDRRAEAICDGCGRFLCRLCEIKLGGRRLCGGCFSSATQAPLAVRHSIVQYDSLALAMVALPLLSFVFGAVTLFTAPAAVWLALQHWRRPMSVLPRTRFRMTLALALGVLVTLGWIALFGVLAYAILAKGSGL